MFGYYIQLGLRSLRRNPVLTLLMVLGIGLGIAASMTTLTVMHLMGADPIPWKWDKLRYVQLDNWDPNNSFYDDGRPHGRHRLHGGRCARQLEAPRALPRPYQRRVRRSRRVLHAVHDRDRSQEARHRQQQLLQVARRWLGRISSIGLRLDADVGRA